MEPLRNYHYLSRAKVEMFWDQLPGSRWSGGGEVGVSAGISASLKLQRNQREPTLAAKMLQVEDHINQTDFPGTLISSNSPFIRDRLAVSMVVLETEGRHESNQPTLTGTVLFAGRSRSGVSVVLGGSAVHLLGAQAPPTSGINSSFYYLQHQITHASAEWRTIGSVVEADTQSDDALYDPDDDPPQHGGGDEWLRDCILQITDLAVRGDRRFQSVGYCEFLARTIKVLGEDRYRPYADAILATPLYVNHLDVAEPGPDPLPDPWGDDLWGRDP